MSGFFHRQNLIIELVQTQLLNNIAALAMNCLSHEPKGIDIASQGGDTHVPGEDDPVELVHHGDSAFTLGVCISVNLAYLLLMITITCKSVHAIFVGDSLSCECNIVSVCFLAFQSDLNTCTYINSVICSNDACRNFMLRNDENDCRINIYIDCYLPSKGWLSLDSNSKWQGSQ